MAIRVNMLNGYKKKFEVVEVKHGRKMIKYEELNIHFLIRIFPEFEHEIRSEVEAW